MHNPRLFPAAQRPIDLVLARVGTYRKTPRGWSARCPAHEDRSPSLSIAIGTDGRVLVRCFTGCDTREIVAALDLELHDLFERTDRAERRPRPQPTEANIRAALRNEIATFRRIHAIDAGDELLTHERNEIRARVARRLDITLSPLPAPPWEGNYGGRERDPLWAATFERAWQELWLEHGSLPPYTLRERTRRGPRLPARSLIKIEDRATQIFAVREEARRARCA